MDDEAALLSLIEQFLRRLGYEVDACSSATEAFERFEANPAAYAAVITDILMPGLSGREMVLKFLERNPRLAIIICTGVPFALSGLPEKVQRQVAYVQKPFAPWTLSEALERLLADTAGTNAG